MNIIINTHCPVCLKETPVTVSEEGYKRYKDGEMIQSALSELSDAEREMLISGICDDCWNRMFSEEE